MPKKQLSAERRQFLIRALYKTFMCKICSHHMEQVMPGELCWYCFESQKRKRGQKLTARALAVPTNMARIARGYMNLKIPDDFIIRRMVKQVSSSFPNLGKPVEEYLDGLFVIVVNPIVSYSAQELKKMELELIKRGVKFVSTNFKADMKKKIIIADKGDFSSYSNEKLNSLAILFRCPVVDTMEFFKSLRSGCSEQKEILLKRLCNF